MSLASRKEKSRTLIWMQFGFEEDHWALWGSLSSSSEGLPQGGTALGEELPLKTQNPPVRPQCSAQPPTSSGMCRPRRRGIPRGTGPLPLPPFSLSHKHTQLSSMASFSLYLYSLPSSVALEFGAMSAS